MPSPARILFLAADAADGELIARWADEGVLPTFRSLRERAAQGTTVNPTGLYVGAIWPSFWTGLSPGRHGRYCFEQIRSGSYEKVHVAPSETRGEPFWDRLSEAGRRVVIVDVPKTFVSPRVRGVQLVDWGTHDPELEFDASPPSLVREVETRFGRYPVGSCDEFVGRGPDALAGLRDALLRGIAMKEKLCEHLLAQGGWDLFLAVFAESHCAGHQFWRVHDPSHPRHDPEQARALGDPLRDVYVAIDAAIGRLLRLATPDTTVFVLASHGMGPHYDATFLLDEILRRLAEAPAPAPGRRALARAVESAWRRVPAPLKRALRPIRRGVKGTLGDAATHPEPEFRDCFSVPNNDVYGGIRVNLAGREPSGRIRPGAELDAFCESLTRDLLTFVNDETGEPLVRRVLRTSDLYLGERVGDLPDLLVEWNRDAPVTSVSSPRTGAIRGVFDGQRSGDHKAEGVVFALGPDIPPGPLGRPVSITSFAPTIGAILGVPLAGLDGEPVERVIPAGARSASEV